MGFLKGFSAFLDYKYWLNPRPVPLGPSLAAGILIFFCWFLLVALILWLIARAFRKSDALKADLFRRFARLFSTTGIVGLLLLFFAYEQAPILGMRFWTLILFIYFFIRLGLNIAYAARDYPGLKANVSERQRFEKWLPGKNK